MYNEHEIDQTMQAWMQTKRFTANATTNAAIRERYLKIWNSWAGTSRSRRSSVPRWNLWQKTL
jgi:hypothetical protein